ncbi:UDP-N-acetylglucosamine/UDP-N-acetylgalactosaminediphosphorylase [Lachnospiraceae bacterium XBB2008]|nr:UDP-N-acetylglucosamine/UDP-N-acetylgalactosaminediphosphorylase [Lachnospiraceae bacterium XBB2008]
MTYQEAYAKLEAIGQTQLLRYYDELSAEEQAALLAQIDETDFSVIKYIDQGALGAEKGVISPLECMELPEIEANKERFTSLGFDAIANSRVGAVLLAGGMGTRLGSDDPKGMYNIGLTRTVYIFQRLIENTMDVIRAANAHTGRNDIWIPFYIMTSEKNNDATIAFFEQQNYFGYNKDFVHFFKQDMAPATDRDGKVYLEGRGRIATSPNGNAGWFKSLVNAGLLDGVHEQGIEYLNIFAVDNVLQRIADPAFVGACIERDVEVGAKVVAKAAPDEAIGVMCLEDGRPSIVEYYEMTDEIMHAKNDKGEPAYRFGVILNYLFKVSALEDILSKSLPMHVVEKKIPYLNEEGELIKPDKPNGFKFEQLVLDMIHQLASCLPYEVVREKEFAPIKNKTGVDSVESARELCKLNGIEL